MKKLDTWHFVFWKSFVQTIHTHTCEYLFIYNIVCEYLFQIIIYKQGMWSLFIHSMWGAFYHVARNNIYNIMWIFITAYLACEYLYTIYLACECLQRKNRRGRVKKIAPYCHSPCFSHLSCKNTIERTLMPRKGEGNMLAWLVPIGSIKLNHRHKPLKMQF